MLLVEDDAEVREVVRNFLDSLGCQVTLAASGEQALAGPRARRRTSTCCSATSRSAPGMRGTRLAELAQARLPRMAVLLMSGYSAELLDADRDAPLELGAAAQALFARRTGARPWRG